MGAEMRSTAVSAWLCLALLGACDKPPPAAEIRPVRTVTAVAGSDGELVSLTGHIRAQTEQSLAFRIDGRMIKRHVEVGQVVRPNDLIAELDHVPQRDALNEAQAKLAAAEATLHEASNNMERKRTLTGQGWSTKADYVPRREHSTPLRRSSMSPRRNYIRPRTISATASFARTRRAS